MQFATVGASGVVVNLACLSLFKALRVHINAASALAIEISLLSNFVINYAWTFRDRRADAGGILLQAWRFHLVCLIGAAVQFLSFVALNVVWLHLFHDAQVVADYYAGQASWLERWLWHPLWHPPDVGNWVYLSQLLGIGAGTAWNYLLNFYWTWGRDPSDSGDEASP